MMMSRSRAALLTLVLLAIACGSSTPTPTAVATPTPAPTPAAVASPKAFTCFLPAMKDQGIQCPKVTPQLLDHVNAAVDTVLQTKPQLFDFNDVHGGSVKVLDHQAYQQAVVDAVNAQGGICAKNDNEEIALKVNNDYNEQYNVWTSSGYTRRSYITTCFPAQF